jgi:hypothetical protein
MSGALAASVDLKHHERPRLNPRLVVLMLACAIMVALSSLLFKVVALRDEFWITTF